MSTAKNGTSLLIRGVLGALIQVMILAILLLIPAGILPEGTWFWKRAVQFLFVYGFLVLTSVIVLIYLAPEGLEARLQAPFGKVRERKDKLVTNILVLSMLMWTVFIPMDVFSLKLLAPPTYTMSILGVLIFLEGFVIIGLALYQKAFADPHGKDRSDNRQILVETGVYALVRHPMYLGFLVFFTGMALWLGSYPAAIGVLIVFFSFVPKIKEEEKQLLKHLNGYDEYAQKVKYRLIPFIW